MGVDIWWLPFLLSFSPSQIYQLSSIVVHCPVTRPITQNFEEPTSRISYLYHLALESEPIESQVTMSDLIRDAPIGAILRWATRNKILQYPEEKPDFHCPTCYSPSQATPTPEKAEPSLPVIDTLHGDVLPSKPESDDAILEKRKTLERTVTASTASSSASNLNRPQTTASARPGLERVATREALQASVTREDLERQFTIASVTRGPSKAVEPAKLDDGTILVDWYTTG